MHIKPGSIVEMLTLGPEPIDPRHAHLFRPGTQHRVIGYDPETREVELFLDGDNPGDGLTFFDGEYKPIVE